MVEDRELPLTEHLAELRQRLIRCLLAVVVTSAASYGVIEPIFNLLSRPLIEVMPPGRTLIFSSYPEAFFIYIKLAITSGIFLASPYIIYQALAFAAPGLYDHEKRYLYPFVLLGSILFIGGGLFGYFVAFPAAFRFLASYQRSGLLLLPNVSEYFSLTVRLLLGFGLAFEVPLFMVFLGLIGIIDSRFLRKNRKYALLVVFILAAILTPTPDVINQLVMAVPLLLLYELSILLVWITGGRRRPRVEE